MIEEKRTELGKDYYYSYEDGKILDDEISNRQLYLVEQEKKQVEFDKKTADFKSGKLLEQEYLLLKKEFQVWQEVTPFGEFNKEPWDELKHSPLKIDLLTEAQLQKLANKLLPFINQQSNTKQ